MGRNVKENYFWSRRIMKAKALLSFEIQGKTNLVTQRQIPEDTNVSFDNYKNSIIIYSFNV
jgi:hypothetical protein